METPILSVIIPIYKVEPYLDACVKSVLNQSLDDMEIILVDDGSPDNCGKMCDDYASKDSRIVVIHKGNGGLSSARNAALEIAKGEYITFVDSDDEIEPDTYKKNISYLLKDKEIDILQFPTYWSYGTSHAYRKVLPVQFICGSESIFTNWWEGLIINPAVCNKIYHRSMFKEIRFPEGHVFEDLFLISDFSKYANKVMISPQGCYLYYVRNDSISNCVYSLNKHIDHFTSQFKNYKILYAYENLCNKRVLAFMRVYRRLLTAKESYSTFDDSSYISSLKNYIPQWKDIQISSVSGKEKFRVAFIKLVGLSAYQFLFISYVRLRSQFVSMIANHSKSRL